MKVCFTMTGLYAKDFEQGDYASEIAERVEAANTGMITVTADPFQADLIILLESCSHLGRRYGFELARHPLAIKHRERILIWSYTDYPIPFWNGLYVSLRKPWFDRSRHRACCYFRDYNKSLAEFEDSRVEPTLLAGFHGALSHPSRNRLLELASTFGPDIEISTSDKWFNHNAEELTGYGMRLLKAKYSLCPRGLATSTYRLYESMQLGRAPVIISDEWVPPEGPDWHSFALFVPESRLADLPTMLAKHEPEWRERGTLARKAWEQWFAGSNRYKSLMQQTLNLWHSNPAPPDPRQWQSEWFYWRFGETRLQGLARRLRRLVGRTRT